MGWGILRFLPTATPAFYLLRRTYETRLHIPHTSFVELTKSEITVA